MKDRRLSVAEKLRLGGYLPDMSSFDVVVSMIGGNYYNTFGLIENPIRFDFTEPGETNFALPPGRELITYGLIHHFFSDTMTRGFLQNVKALKESCGRSFFHVASPPPVDDNDHIANNPGGYFSDKVHLGVAPPALRLKLYHLHETVVRDFCNKESIGLLPPPRESVTSQGFLERRFWKSDPTHANAAYGALVIEQIRRASSHD